MSLKTTIRQIQARDNDLEFLSDNKDEFIQKWNSEVIALYAEFREMLKSLESEGFLSFDISPFIVKEDGIGDYSISALHIRAGSREILAVPTARLTNKSAGRVELFRKDRPSERDKFYLFRNISEEGNMYWSIEEKNIDDQNMPAFALQIMPIKRKFTMLYAGSLEAALDYLLQI